MQKKQSKPAFTELSPRQAEQVSGAATTIPNFAVVANF